MLGRNGPSESFSEIRTYDPLIYKMDHAGIFAFKFMSTKPFQLWLNGSFTYIHTLFFRLFLRGFGRFPSFTISGFLFAVPTFFARICFLPSPWISMVNSTSSGYSYVPASFSLIFTVSDIKSRTLGLPGDKEELITRNRIARLS